MTSSLFKDISRTFSVRLSTSIRCGRRERRRKKERKKDRESVCMAYILPTAPIETSPPERDELVNDTRYLVSLSTSNHHI